METLKAAVIYIFKGLLTSYNLCLSFRCSSRGNYSLYFRPLDTVEGLTKLLVF